jgi:hypothetical protein
MAEYSPAGATTAPPSDSSSLHMPAWVYSARHGHALPGYSEIDPGFRGRRPPLPDDPDLPVEAKTIFSRHSRADCPVRGARVALSGQHGPELAGRYAPEVS